MDACFNRVHWEEWEAAVKKILREQHPTAGQSGTAYLVTGVVPASSDRILRMEVLDDPNTREFNRVTIPTHVWTAVCYISPLDEKESFSFGYIGVNQPHGILHVRTIKDVTGLLSKLYGGNNLKIFEEDCFFQNLKSEQMVKKLYTEIQKKQASRLNLSPDAMNILYTAQSFSDSEITSHPAKIGLITDTKKELVFNTIDAWWKAAEEIKFVSGLACPLVPLNSLDLKMKNEQPRKWFAILLLRIWMVAAPPCLYNEEAGDYYCSNGLMTKPCSPRYSDITFNGKKCRSDHTCGKHGKNYYWCYTDHSWEYCSPPLPLGVTGSGKRCRAESNCAMYENKYFSCENEDGKWEKCCQRANRFSAFNGRTCKTEKPCGKYGKRYIWCYTTDHTWDYCCTT
ncbi:hypothetical protein EXN66_Car013934 [Channa argus]|uniref:Endonuclease domain-containing 1 protein n=1 Tax=Channa argus TaxID=215402 RepID=A0A6G1Q7D5_CHAAH|nr:hypothetical protein EXN66_Car013934 [Channa argus]